MPLPKGFRLEPDVRTGTIAGDPQKVGYSSGTSNPPNGGQVTDVDNPEPNDAISLPKGFRLEQPLPAGATAPLPSQPSAPVPTALKGPLTTSQSLNLPGLALTAAHDAGQAGIGALKGAGSTLNSIGNVATLGATSNPALRFYNEHLGTHFNIPTPEQLNAPFVPSNTAQSVGKGLEQAGEFLLPGLGEEAAGAKLAEIAPRLGRAAAPLARLGVSALGSGAVNSLQGGDFGTGALAGGVAGGVGEGLKAIAPNIAESALKIRKLDRAYKPPRAIGRAALDETSGITPSAVGESAQSRLNELNPQVDAIADRLSVRPNNPRGLLPAPPQEIPLGTPFVPKMPGDLLEAEQFPPQNVAQARVIRNGQGQILPRSDRLTAFPNENGVLPPARNPYNGQMLPQKIENLPFTRQAFMAGSGDELPPVINQRIGPGVLLRRAEGSAGPIPATLPNTSASLRPSRGLLSGAVAKAAAQGERTTLEQLDPMMRHLTETVEGEPIQENITPRNLLDLQRGFGNEFVNRWNPETMEGVKGTAAQVYHELGNEFDRVAPEAQAIRSRISPLITVAKRANSADLNAPLAQRLAGRLTAHTGAATLGGLGALEGFREHNPAKALEYGAAGVLAPELLSEPAVQMTAARFFNSGAPAAMTRVVGGGAMSGAGEMRRLKVPR